MADREKITGISDNATAKAANLLQSYIGPGYTERMAYLMAASAEPDADNHLIQIAMLNEVVALLAVALHQQQNEITGLREFIEERSEETADTLVFVSRLLRALHEKLDAQQLHPQRKE